MIGNRLRHWRHVAQYRWRHDRGRGIVLLVAVAVVAIAIGAFVISRGGPADDPYADAPPYVSPGSPLPLNTGTPTASPSASGTPSAPATPPDGVPLDAFSDFGAYDPRGFGGTGGISGATRHDLRLSASSQVPISYVGYQIPTSVERPTGIDRSLGTSWRLTTRVYGTPDYARVFVQAGAAGIPVTCTVTVDGAVTDQRTTEGPYGIAVCQG